MNSTDTEKLYEEKDKGRESRCKISKAKTPKKSNHKHDYDPVIFKYKLGSYTMFKDKLVMSPGKKCKICGRLDAGFPNDFYEVHIQPYFKKHYPESLRVSSWIGLREEYFTENPDNLTVIRVINPYKTPIEEEKEEND